MRWGGDLDDRLKSSSIHTICDVRTLTDFEIRIEHIDRGVSPLDISDKLVCPSYSTT